MTSKWLYKSSMARNTAQKRWRLLARALIRSLDFFEDEVLKKNSEEISVRRFTSFDLLHQIQLENEAECSWCLYTGLLNGELYEILVRRISKFFTANELIGFNNTGNVCVWPSEECLAYYLLKEFNGETSYQVILCADCLFFDEARIDLVDTIKGWLADDGVALIMAPRRGNTFREFTEVAVERGFITRQTETYDMEIWSRHLDLLVTNHDYCPDLHFPVLLELTKQKKFPPG